MRISLLSTVIAGFVAFALNTPAFAVEVPEPASVGLGVLGLGIVALACVRRRR